ncbi:TetR/AcrR family transcriptional regulator [Suttonella ornithocola]|uniref:Potential acrAB operon repressor n=1 Tax=Suttonella ornithocola TaxID=279832 RepID=A0A380MUQ8_9GAMM|nr:TetR/AcrR family transcriptional regulator [Suttonella ornithocola]SUO95441.1 Potential acrAB operon repressor [Suttonella ornithocola]
MRRTKAEAEQTRTALLTAGLILFDEKGYRATTISDIATAANLTRGAFYWHFKDKTDLLSAIGEKYFDHLSQQIQSAADSATPWTTLSDVYCQFFRTLLESKDHLHFHRLLNTQQSTPESPLATLLQRYKQVWHQQLNNILKQALETGILPPRTDLTLARNYLIVNISGIACHYAVTPELQTQAETIIKRTFSFIKQGGCITV